MERACPVNGGWGGWKDVGGCGCDESPFSTQDRHRYCNNPVPENGGEPCRGCHFRLKVCQDGDGCEAECSPEKHHVVTKDMDVLMNNSVVFNDRYSRTTGLWSGVDGDRIILYIPEYRVHTE